MDDILEKAFVDSENMDFNTNDYLLMAILKRLNMLFDRIDELEAQTKPRMIPSPS